MFFLGVSAHLFMYLLLPALIVIWLYFRGVACNLETVNQFPERVEYSHTISDSVVKLYDQSVQKKIESQKSLEHIAVLLKKEIIGYVFYVYQQPLLQNLSLRAPPSLA